MIDSLDFTTTIGMKKKSSPQPTEVELQILRVLWDLGKSPVRDIHKRLCESKATNYSTTVKMLSVMLDKGLVKRDDTASPHLYRPALTRDRAGKHMVRDLIDKVYDGAAMSLVLQALASANPTKDELDEVRQLLDEMESP